MSMNSSNENPVYLKYKKKYEDQPMYIKEKIDNFRNNNYQLKVIKRCKPIITLGDVFLLSPRIGVYFYGKVLKTKIRTINNDVFVDGKHTIFIHKCKTKTITLNDYIPNYDDLLINPSIVDISYWQKGYFYNIGNLPITDIEKNLDYGFYKLGIPGIHNGWFCTEEGEKLCKTPQLMGIYGIATITGIAAEVEKELIMNPSLLK